MARSKIHYLVREPGKPDRLLCHLWGDPNQTGIEKAINPDAVTCGVCRRHIRRQRLFPRRSIVPGLLTIQNKPAAPVDGRS